MRAAPTPAATISNAGYLKPAPLSSTVSGIDVAPGEELVLCGCTTTTEVKVSTVPSALVVVWTIWLDEEASSSLVWVVWGALAALEEDETRVVEGAAVVWKGSWRPRHGWCGC